VSGPRLLARIFEEVAARIDGAALVAGALSGEPFGSRLHVLALGKVAGPMLAGLSRALGGPDRIAGGLLVAPADRLPDPVRVPANVQCLAGDHPVPAERSVRAGEAIARFVGQLRPPDQLLVLLSGGGSALAVAPPPGLSFEDKRAATTAVARGGAAIGQLNTVRKHLSAIKGGQLGAAAQVPVQVYALSDVIGNDPGTIASGPFSADPTTFQQALSLLDQHAPGAAPAARAWLARGAAGELPETPKPGDPRLSRVRYQILAGPERVTVEARTRVLAAGVQAGELSFLSGSDVQTLASEYGGRARAEAAAPAPARGLIGNGEPTIVVRGSGRGGRATHLALLMAREIAGLEQVAFLAAGTDDRDGSTSASGAVVDGQSWRRMIEQGLDPEGALDACDSARPLEAAGCLVRGPGTSNLLDLHLLSIGWPQVGEHVGEHVATR
jgi:glycerate 2-kinase